MAFRRSKTPPRRCETPGCDILTRGKHCPGCRVRKCRRSGVAGGACRVPGCAVTHPRMLRRQRFADATAAVLCANHAALVGRRTITLDAFLAELAPGPGERRQARERRRQVERRHGTERRQYAEPVELDGRLGDRRVAMVGGALLGR